MSTVMDKRRLLDSLQKLDHEMRTSHYPAVMEETVKPVQYIERLSEAEAVEFYGYGSDAI